MRFHRRGNLVFAGLLALGLLAQPRGQARAESNKPAGDIKIIGSAGGGKAGRFMVGLKLAPAIGIQDNNNVDLFPTETQFALQLEAGYAFDSARRAYVLFPLQFHFGGGATSVMVPLGFQYDLPITPLPGLYVYPRITLGYAAVIAGRQLGGGTYHGGVIIPEFGVKYVIKKRVNLGFEPFSLPIFFGPKGSTQGYDPKVALQYRLLFYGGVNF